MWQKRKTMCYLPADCTRLLAASLWRSTALRWYIFFKRRCSIDFGSVFDDAQNHVNYCKPNSGRVTKIAAPKTHPSRSLDFVNQFWTDFVIVFDKMWMLLASIVVWFWCLLAHTFYTFPLPTFVPMSMNLTSGTHSSSAEWLFQSVDMLQC